MKIQEIIEARRNPQLNKKQHPILAIQQAYENTSDEVYPGIKNLFISVTSIDKLGINPSTGYETTPNGIYFWPVEFILAYAKDKWGDWETTDQGSIPISPYSQSTEYIKLFSIDTSKNTLVMSHEDDRCDTYVNKIYNMIEKFIPGKLDKFKSAVDEEIDGSLVGDTPGMRFFESSRIASQILPQYNGVSHTNAWASLIRKALGIDVLMDMGEGIFEPTSTEYRQGVVFSKDTIKTKTIKTFDNTDSAVNTHIDRNDSDIAQQKRQEYNDIIRARLTDPLNDED